MALTKVSGGILDPGINVAGIVTATGFDGPFTGGSSKNITAGIITATGFDLNGNGDISGNLVIGGNLTANGDFTTLNTTLREVELLRVDAQDNTVTAGIITQRGTGNILDLYDTSSAVFSVRDGGNIIMGASAGSITPHAPLHIRTATTGAITTLLKLHGPFTSNTGSEGTAIDFGTASDTSTGARIIGSREAAGAKGALRFCTGRENDAGFNDGHMVIDETGNVLIENGNVGIGTDNAGRPLTIRHADPRIRLIDDDSGSFSEIYTDDNGHLYLNADQGQNNGGSRIVFNIDNDEKVRITNAGRIGIGSAIPSQLLDVAGTIKTTNITSDSSNLSIENTADRVLIKSANRVDIADNMIRFQNRAQNAALLEAVAGASGYVKLYHNNNVVASVTMDALTVTGRTSNSGMVEIASNQGANNNDRFRIHKTSAASRLTIQNYASGNWVENIRITAGGAVELKHSDGTTHFETTAGGAAISNIQNNEGLNLNGVGNNTCIKFLSTGSSPAHGYRIAYHSTTNYVFNSPAITFDKIATNGNFSNHIAAISDSGFHLADNKKLHIGGAVNASSATGDLQLYHDGSDNYIDGNSKAEDHLYIRANVGTDHSSNIHLQAKSGEDSIVCRDDEQVELYYDGNQKLRTTETGALVTGEVAASQDYPNFRPTLDLNFAAEKKLDPRITYQRTGVASFVNEFGKVVLIGNNVPRFDYDPITRERKGLLIEQQRTNLFTYSSEFDQIHWSNVRTTDSKTVATNDPQGLQTAFKIIANTDNNTHRIDKTNLSMSTSTVYTMSLWAKAAEYTGVSLTIADSTNNANGVYFDLSAGTFTIPGNAHTGRMEAYPNGWYRCFATFTTPSTINFNQCLIGVLQNGTTHTYAGNGSSGIYIWGAQLEQGGFETSYIPTGATTESRGVDLVEITEEEFSEFYNQTEGSIVSEIMLKSSWPVSGYASIMMTFSDNTYNNRITLASSTGSAAFNADVAISGSTIRAALGSYTSGAHSIKAAIAYKASDSAGSLNGRAAVTTSPGTLPLLTRADIGKDHNNGNPLNGHIKRIMYYSKRLPNSQLVTLTS